MSKIGSVFSETLNIGNLENRKSELKTKVNEINENMIEFTEDLIETSYKIARRWQDFFSKSVQKIEPLVENQVDVIFDSLEGVSKQLVKAGEDWKSFRAGNKTFVKTSKNEMARAKSSSQKKAAKEDLKLIDGIGPKIEELLNAAGIWRYEDLANAPYHKIQEILDSAGSRFRMHDPSYWMTQAAYAAKGSMDELEAWKKSQGASEATKK